MTNILIAIKNIIQNPITELISTYKWQNRANNMWEALECYIKDMFSDSFHETDSQKKDKIHSNFFSYLGNQNNPPDIVLKDWDAIEIKKISNFSSWLALNSSYPKNKLYSSDSRIKKECKNCDWWNREKKDILYIIGVSLPKTNKIQTISFVYWDCYAADKEIYIDVYNKISKQIAKIPDIQFTKTNELAKVKKVDPLWITDLRVRWMRHIENPIKLFKDFFIINQNKNLTLNILMLEEKYLSFPQEDRKNLELLQDEFFRISDIQIKSPNNPAQLLKAKFISYVK